MTLGDRLELEGLEERRRASWVVTMGTGAEQSAELTTAAVDLLGSNRRPQQPHMHSTA
jgi:hypothetical protein